MIQTQNRTSLTIETDAEKAGKHPKCKQKKCDENGILSGCDNQGGWSMRCCYCVELWKRDILKRKI